MALTLPYPDLDFVPLDILTAEELNEIVANYTYISNQFPLTSDKIDWTTITRTSFSNTSYFSQVDVNEILIFGNVVHVVFRGKIGSTAVPSNAVILNGNLPKSNISSREAGGLGYTSSSQYTVSTPLWGYVGASGGLQTQPVAANLWVHINFTYFTT